VKGFAALVLVISLLTVACFLSVDGCDRETGIAGTVTAKQWVPSWVEIQTMLIPDGNNGFMTIFMPITHDDEWWIWCGSSKTRVSKQEFKRVEVEQWFDNRKKSH